MGFNRFYGTEEDLEDEDLDYKRVFGRRGDEVFDINRRCMQMIEFIEADPRWKDDKRYKSLFSKLKNFNRQGYKILKSQESVVSKVLGNYELVAKLREHNRKAALERLARKTGEMMKNRRMEEYEVEEVTPNGTQTVVLQRYVYD